MSEKPMIQSVLCCSHVVLHLRTVTTGEHIRIGVAIDALKRTVELQREDGTVIEKIVDGERLAWALKAVALLGDVVEFFRPGQPSCVACGFVAGDLSPKSVEYHRAHRAAHLDKFPDVDAGTRAALDLMVALAEKHEQASGPVVS